MTCITVESRPETGCSALQAPTAVRRRTEASGGRSLRLGISAEKSPENSEHVFGEKGYVAGIPISAQATACGQRLRHTLQHRPHEFVAAALQDLQVRKPSAC